MSRYTKWIPLKSYFPNGDEVLVQARRNKKTGWIQFKNTKVTNIWRPTCGQVNIPLDIKVQWAELESESE